MINALFKAILPAMASNENSGHIDIGSDSGDSSGQHARERDSSSRNASDTMIYDADPPDSRRHGPRSRRQSTERYRKLRSSEKEKHKIAEELERSKRTNQELEIQAAASQSTIQDLRDAVDAMKRLASRYEADLQAALHETSRLEEQGRRQSEELQRLKAELRQAETHHDQTRRLLEERTRELSGAQKFLTQTDSLSGADVITIVESLNAEILQAAASMAESLEFTYKSSHTEALKKEAYDNATHMIGADMLHVLISRSTQMPSEFDPTPVQIALQICIVRCCDKIAGRWTINSGRLDQSLKDIYKRICEKEKQAVSGRWRSLARAQTKHGEDRRDMLSYMVRQVTEVLVVAGWSAHGSATEPGFNLERLTMVVDLALRLNVAIGEDITSVDILPLIFRTGINFDSTTMDDTYAADIKKGSGHDVIAVTDFVAGTTDLGLQRINRETGTGHPRTDILLKPKVILHSAIQEEFLG